MKQRHSKKRLKEKRKRNRKRRDKMIFEENGKKDL